MRQTLAPSDIPAPAVAMPHFPRAGGVGFGRVLALALIAHLAAFAYVAAFLSVGEDYTDVFAFQSYGQKMQMGLLPYRDFPVEYPPLATILFWVPMHFSHDWDSYARAFSAQIALFELAGVAIALWAMRQFAPQVPVWGIMVAQPIWFVTVGRGLVFARFDLVAAVVALLAIVLFVRGDMRWAWAVLGIATAIKLYPIVIAPLFVLIAWPRRTPRQLLADMATFAAAVLVPAFLISGGQLVAIRTMFTYHLDRSLEIESLYASLLMLAHLAGNPAKYTMGHGSIELSAPQVPFFTALALPATVLALGATYAIAWRDADLRSREAERGLIFDRLTRLSALAVLAFMLAGKVLSPQYLLWLYPLAGVFINRRAIGWWALYWLALLLTQWIFPVHWHNLMDLRSTPIVMLAIRNGILIVLGAILFKDLLAAEPPPPAVAAQPVARGAAASELPRANGKASARAARSRSRR